MKYKIVLFIILATNLTFAAQTCRLETEIPSTTPNERFVDNTNGTISDTETGLMWQKCSLGLSGSDCLNGTIQTYSFLQAIDEGVNSTLANLNDWRLPDVKELLSLVEYRCFSPAINLSIFPRTSSSRYYTSSSIAQSNFSVQFSAGNTTREPFHSLFNVRLVRLEN